MKLLDGIKLAKKTKKNIRQKVANYVTEGKRAPHLAAVLVGEDPASNAYVKMKIKDCEEVGFKSTLIKKDADISEKELLEIVHELNENKELDGYIVQLPLPKHINEDKILQAIDPQKDVDGFHPTNVGKMALGLETFLPATPFGVMRLLEDYDIATSGKKCVVLGRSNIVGRPMSILMSQPGKHANSTVTICHSGTKNLVEFTQEADIIISAIGKPHFLTSEMVKEGVIIIDVGINRVYDESKKDYKLVGDVDFENIKSKADYITPVPGGVGPMTRAMLLENTLLAYKRFAQ
ncbi:Bifunctional protein FolD [Candidatus Ornithobacterium hominis]|uniref:bifunctional methylenetetrahydrofolate dehydrogenase/methenyltetrahydrofolate cyclohydrolase FolD n=1 Tax=Candidatus Ornithobacterium hominis TaxID=2497989 RepID=UPI000E5B0BCC|nr:bifunctional methylenetetrahydrofolate dehydrogenase/methenyltetrahydrofolate cyclohydrolase FolD [Candidatus Ornithobacterium hominis]SZD72536.1 Bifunctional protein FolD [Candidatus Ornithobacterium hominis]